MIQFLQVESEESLGHARKLFAEYAASLSFNL